MARVVDTQAYLDTVVKPGSVRWGFYAHVWSRLVWLRPQIGKILGK